MDSSFTIKPRDSANRVLHDRSSVARTELSPTRSVPAPDPVPAARDSHSLTDRLPRALTIDPQSEETIRRAREEEERRKRKRVSDEALSRMRAYRQPSPPAAEGESEPPHADIEV